VSDADVARVGDVARARQVGKIRVVAVGVAAREGERNLVLARAGAGVDIIEGTILARGEALAAGPGGQQRRLFLKVMIIVLAASVGTLAEAKVIVSCAPTSAPSL
jgi:hypothetical protein